VAQLVYGPDVLHVMQPQFESSTDPHTSVVWTCHFYPPSILLPREGSLVPLSRLSITSTWTALWQ